MKLQAAPGQALPAVEHPISWRPSLVEQGLAAATSRAARGEATAAPLLRLPAERPTRGTPRDPQQVLLATRAAAPACGRSPAAPRPGPPGGPLGGDGGRAAGRRGARSPAGSPGASPRGAAPQSPPCAPRARAVPVAVDPPPPAAEFAAMMEEMDVLDLFDLPAAPALLPPLVQSQAASCGLWTGIHSASTAVSVASSDL
ncbi:unnamed protein product [Prorocentrum cordatum]|uniref:Uncharacterized protein n=1 Tax=Prorocentrum cordatum TaxID=2364126 RepID=A0ABN9TXE0_9DINO|nr:unnamed protein product [Polarella glacialis]